MFSSSPNYTKLKTNLRLALNRLKLLEKKKTELTMKARKEIADYIQAGKYERAKIRVEHIIREDYLVEAMEIVEMYCDLLLARFGLITQMKELDEGIAEAVSSLIWVSPRMQADVQELKPIAELFASKYGHQYVESCKTEEIGTINEKLKHKLSIQSPPKLLVEKYLIEIANNYNIAYEPDAQVMNEAADGILIDLSDKNNLSEPRPAGFIGYPMPPSLPPAHFNYPNLPSSDPSPGFNVMTNSNNSQHGGIPYTPFSYNIPPAGESKESNISYQNIDQGSKDLKPKISEDSFPTLPDLPTVPSDTPPSSQGGDIDFDDLTRRFEELKKRK
ncbi:hypothetical protein FQA39_LY09681 [Lamprigera yunnana]|nr:hypothetical protein FQA39_LY09681 [Lamprigera yunnana]